MRESSLPDRQRVPEHVPRVPPRFDPLQPRIVGLVVQRVPRHARRIQRRVREVGVGMIDERAVVGVARDRHAAAVGKQIPIERPHPRQIPGLVLRIEPARGAGHVENRTALRGGGRIGRDRIDPAAIGGEPQHPAHDVVIGAGQVVVRDADLAIGEPLLQQRILHLDAHAARRHARTDRETGSARTRATTSAPALGRAVRRVPRSAPPDGRPSAARRPHRPCSRRER